MDLRRGRVGTGLMFGSTHLAPFGMVRRTALGAVAGAAAVGASWAASDLGGRPRWWAVAGAIGLAMVLAGSFPAARRLGPQPGWVGLTQLAWLASVYGCVPETDHVVAVGLLIAGVAAVELVAQEQLPVAWQVGIFGVVLWAGLYGATARQSALVGALFGAWPVLIGPLVARFTHLGRAHQLVRWAVTGVGAAAALIVARTGALQPTIGPALRAVAIYGSVSLAIAAVLGWAGGRGRPVNATPGHP